MGIEPTVDLVSPPPDLKSGSTTRVLATPNQRTIIILTVVLCFFNIIFRLFYLRRLGITRAIPGNVIRIAIHTNIHIRNGQIPLKMVMTGVSLSTPATT